MILVSSIGIIFEPRIRLQMSDISLRKCKRKINQPTIYAKIIDLNVLNRNSIIKITTIIEIMFSIVVATQLTW